MINVLEYLDNTAASFPNKTAFADADTSMKFGELGRTAKAIGSHLRGRGLFKKPVVVFMPKSPQTIAAFFWRNIRRLLLCAGR